MSLFCSPIIFSPFVANVESIYLSIRPKHDAWLGGRSPKVVANVCVLKSIFSISIWLHPPF